MLGYVAEVNVYPQSADRTTGQFSHFYLMTEAHLLSSNQTSPQRYPKYVSV
jgi:hypothetical protein